jgi:hypothetical protein
LIQSHRGRLAQWERHFPDTYPGLNGVLTCGDAPQDRAEPPPTWLLPRGDSFARGTGRATPMFRAQHLRRDRLQDGVDGRARPPAPIR